MNTLIKFSDALCHAISAERPTWPRGEFVNTTREQLARLAAHSLEVTSAQSIKRTKS